MLSSILLIAVLSAQTSIETEEPRSNGLGLTIAGGILTGIGALNLAITPVCRADFYREANGDVGSDVCFYGSLIGGGIFLAVGVPMLVVGLVRRSAWKAWHETNQVFFRIDPEGGALAWQTRF